MTLQMRLPAGGAQGQAPSRCDRGTARMTSNDDGGHVGHDHDARIRPAGKQADAGLVRPAQGRDHAVAAPVQDVTAPQKP